MFYEKKINNLEYMALGHLAGPSFIHFHNEVELIINMGRGAKADVYINAKKYNLHNEGDAIIICPGQVHSFETISDGLFFAFIFPVEYIPRLKKTFLTSQAENPLFNIDEIGMRDVIMSFWKQNENFCLREVKHTHSSFIIGYINIMMAYIYKNLKFIESDKDITIINKIILYLTENYTEQITLKDISDTFKLPHSVISKTFNSATGITIPSFINWIRSTNAAELLTTTDNTITTISSEVGFRTIRNFNRSFYEFYGQTPSEYRDIHK
ncbi:MAG: helix-turn-helix domain-containing protein [Ruminococcaceae bacterium]|nr:helix-turn-helix domain-containing protein [Oscillospiraceae bacterium]